MEETGNRGREGERGGEGNRRGGEEGGRGEGYFVGLPRFATILTVLSSESEDSST